MCSDEQRRVIMADTKLTRRDFLRLAGVTAASAVIVACTPATPEVVEVVKPVIVEKAVVEEVPVEKVVVKEVPVEKVVEKEVQVVVTATSAARPAKQPVIRWMGYTGGRWGMAAEEGAAHFNDMQDEIVVVPENYPVEGFEKLMAMMVAGVAPDILELWGQYFAKLHQKGQLRDLAPLVERDLDEEYIGGFVPNEWEIFGRLSFLPGVRVGMPRYINFMYLHYNRDFFDETGLDYPDLNWTLDDLAEAALRLTEREADGTPERYGMNFPCWTMERMFYHLERFGGAFVRHEDPKNCVMDTPESQEALEWMRQRYWEDNSYAEPLLTNHDWGESVLANGYCAMIEGGGPYHTLRDALDAYHVDFTHPPIGPMERTSYMVSDGYGLWSGGQYQDAAWEVIKYLSDDVNQDIRQRITGQLAARMAVVRKWSKQIVELDRNMEGLNLDVVSEAFEMGYGRDDERFFCQAEAEEVINPLLEKVFVVGGTPVSVFADACAQVEEVQTCRAM